MGYVDFAGRLQRAADNRSGNGMNLNRLTINSTIAAILLSSAVVTQAPSSVQAESEFEVTPVDVGFDTLSSANTAPNAGFAVVRNAGTVRHVDVSTGATTDVDLVEPSTFDAFHVYSLQYRSIRRQSVATGVITSASVPDSNNYTVNEIHGASSDGRLVLLGATLYGDPGDPLLHGIFDMATGIFALPLEPGLDPDQRNTFDARLSANGDVVRYSVITGPGLHDEVELRLSTGERTVVSAPPESAADDWTASQNLEWLTFRSSERVLTGAGSPTEYLYRRHVPTGTTSRVNLGIPGRLVQNFRVTDNGRVFASYRPFGNIVDGSVILVWSNSDDPVLTAPLPDRVLLDGSREVFPAEFAVSADGSRVTYTTGREFSFPDFNPFRRVVTVTISPVDPNDADPPPEQLFRTSVEPRSRPVPGGPPVEVGPALPADLEGYRYSLGSNSEHVALSYFGIVHVDLVTGDLVETDISSTVAVADDAIFGSHDGALLRWTVSSGEVDVFDIDFPADGAPWRIDYVVDATADGRYVLIDARGTSGNRMFLVDAQTGQPVPWAPDGLPNSEGRDTVIGDPARFTADEQHVLLMPEFFDTRVQRWDVTTGTVTTADLFAGYDNSGTISDDLQWETFVTRDDPLGTGTNDRRTFRRNLATGDIAEIPVGEEQTFNVRAYNDGLVMWSAYPTAQLPGGLFSWDTPNEPRSVVPDGLLETERVREFRFNDSNDIASIVAEPATNPPPPGSEFRLIQIDLSEPEGPTCFGEPVTVDMNAGELPTDGDDVILGTDGDDVIAAGSGNDIVCAGAGNDVINGGSGTDLILGESGNDSILGAGGADVVAGGTGNDLLLGGGGDDLVIAQFGSNIILGGAGNDWLVGGDGNDTIFGQDGDDQIAGLDGIDRCIAGDGTDTVSCEIES